MRPGWVRPCECGQVGRGVYCLECRGFGDGYAGGTWELPKLAPLVEQPTPEQIIAAIPDGPTGVTMPETYCPGGHRGATVRRNAAYCAECGGRIPPTASSSSSGIGTGH